ncbi:MAG: class I SAM-dependent DNA methyltransferase [Gemmatimonadota bacterium]|nr:class I SAM-dependent DNA methyltransferase [Gemmatimonadota bacterium]
MTDTVASSVVPADVLVRLRQLADDWRDIDANERAAFQTWFLKFCEALDVPGPVPPHDDYRFELPVRVVDREGTESSNFIDCWKAGHFALEAKATGEAKPERALRRAFGQVRNYAAHVSGDSPPFLMVVDIPRTLMVWDRWSGSYGDFAAGKRIALLTLHERPDDVALLRDILTNPAARDPRGRAQAVTQAIAGRLAHLAARLESRGYEQERVARFLMRCVFSCFAEDVGLLPTRLFERTLETARVAGGPEHVGRVLSQLWQTMDAGGSFGADLVHRFNGHFFKTVESLPLDADDIDLLVDASRFDWARVEPSIFGTLLVRALDPAERHRLGAEYTPRAYIERLVEPTVVEPIRERWTAVQGSVLQLEESGKKKDTDAALTTLVEFHAWMRGLRFLDPACGSGNFLYVTMAAVKRVELEVLHEIERVSGGQGGLVLEEVHPRQFYGIEIKPWAREIAELTLWIGYHQFWRDAHGGRTPPDPILEDTGTLECRDAILAYDGVRHVPAKDRPDPTPRLVHPVTGELVPDPSARLPYYEHINARPAEWPAADFIVGNPPYLGQARQREAFGDGYVEALRSAYPMLPDSIDLVMYWWYRSAACVAGGTAARAGLITTNSITQLQNRAAIAAARELGANVIWVVPDHPWRAESDGASVRVALTVMGTSSGAATLVRVDDDARILFKHQHRGSLNDDLSAGADVATAARTPLRSQAGLASPGLKLHGPGFILLADEATNLIAADPPISSVIRPYRNGRDLATRPREVFVIDFGVLSEQEARDFTVPFDIVRSRVKPERDSNNDRSTRAHWWRFGRNREDFRPALAGIKRYFATPETSAHRVWTPLPHTVAPDNTLVCVAVEDGWVFGVLCSTVHTAWAIAAGSRLGIGNDARYNKTLCFDPFPFPDASPDHRATIAAIAERLDAHRTAALARDERVTMTGMYSVVEKLRAGTALTPKERVIHEIAACGVLKDIHDELDAAVAAAYAWPWPMPTEEILERLVALHDERVAEEQRGLVRWLRPEYQIPRFGVGTQPAALALDDVPTRSSPEAKTPAAEVPAVAWPDTAVEQITLISAALAQGAQSPEVLTARFAGAKRELVERHLETLALLGEARRLPRGSYAGARAQS